MNRPIPLLNVKLIELFDFVTEAKLFFDQVSQLTNVGSASDFDTRLNTIYNALKATHSGMALIASSDSSLHSPNDTADPRVRYLFHYHRDPFSGNPKPFQFGDDGSLFSLAWNITPDIDFDIQLEFGY